MIFQTIFYLKNDRMSWLKASILSHDWFMVPTPLGREGGCPTSQLKQKMADLFVHNYYIFYENYGIIKMAAEASAPWWGRSVVQCISAVLTTTTSRWCAMYQQMA